MDLDLEEDNCEEAQGGGGWESDEGYGDGIGTFETKAAEAVRRALLDNDALLSELSVKSSACENINTQDNGGCADYGNGAGDNMITSPEPGLPPPPLRYVPGDPFANEQPDVGGWAAQFPYLAVIGVSIGPRREGTSSPGWEFIPAPDRACMATKSPPPCAVNDNILEIRGTRCNITAQPLLPGVEEEIFAIDGILEEWIAVDKGLETEEQETDSSVLEQMKEELVDAALDVLIVVDKTRSVSNKTDEG